MLTRRELKQHAKDQLKGNIGILFLCNIIYMAISLGITSIPLVGMVGVFVLIPPIQLGMTKVYMDITYGRKPEVSTLFSGFSQFGQSVLTYLLILGISFLAGIVIVIPFFLLLVIGLSSYSAVMIGVGIAWYFVALIILLIIALGLAMVFYIMAEQPDMSALDLVKASWTMMKGRRWEYFVLMFSFLPWILLASAPMVITYIWLINYMVFSYMSFSITSLIVLLLSVLVALGIYYIWIIPYMALTVINYYHSIKSDNYDDYSNNRQYEYNTDSNQPNYTNDNYIAGPIEDNAYAPETVETPVAADQASENTSAPSNAYGEETTSAEAISPAQNETSAWDTSVPQEEASAEDNSSDDDDDEWSWDNL